MICYALLPVLGINVRDLEAGGEIIDPCQGCPDLIYNIQTGREAALNALEAQYHRLRAPRAFLDLEEHIGWRREMDDYQTLHTWQHSLELCKKEPGQ